MTETEIYQKAIVKFGVKNQIIKAIEELSELQKALCKRILYANNKSDVSEVLEVLEVDGLERNILEEVADCVIVLNQIKMIFNNEKVFKEIYQAKLKRLQGLL